MDQILLIVMIFNEKKVFNNGPQSTQRRHCGGFTLIELIVVIALMGIMLTFSLPRLHETLFLDDTQKSARWIIGKVQTLKETAIQKQKQYVLHIDLDADRFWETDESMSAESIEAAALNAYALEGDIKIIDIEFPVAGKVISGRAEIHFYKSGYTDKAIIHIQDEDQQLSFLIEPFLTKVKYFETYASFDD